MLAAPVGQRGMKASRDLSGSTLRDVKNNRIRGSGGPWPDGQLLVYFATLASDLGTLKNGGEQREEERQKPQTLIVQTFKNLYQKVGLCFGRVSVQVVISD